MENRALETTIALFSLFLAYSLLVTQIGETIASFLSSRAKFLKEGIAKLIGAALTEQLYRHDLIRALGTNGKNPSYFSTALFSRVLLDIVSGEEARPAEPLNPGIPETSRRIISALLVDSDDEVTRNRRATIGSYFDEAMDRVSGEYKRHARLRALLISLALVFGTNLDAIQMAQKMWKNPDARQAGVLLAEKQLAECKPGPNFEDCSKAVLRDLAPNAIPLWTSDDLEQLKHPLSFFKKLMGLLLTALAISLGAPFWFDLLTRLSPGLRAAGPRPASSDPTTERPAA